MSSLTLAPVTRPARRDDQLRPSRAPRAVVTKAGTRPRPEAARLRLTRRGRVVLVLLLVVLAATAALAVRIPAAASSDAKPSGQVARTVTVAPGETLWQIAERVRPGVDPRITIDRIMEMNGLHSADVQAGRQLFVPAS